MSLRPAGVPAFFLALALLWTWPAAISPDWVGRSSDALGTIWTIDAAPRLLAGGLHDVETGWPTGIDYLRPDSYLLLVVGTLLARLDAARVHALLQIIGLAGSAWAAERCAVRLGATRPASVIAGIGYMFGGLASTALLEGHVYQLLNPWLPLLLAAWWQATGRRGRAADGALAALAYTGALLTTAYLGIAAAVLLIGLLVATLPERRVKAAPLLAAAAIGLPVSLLYAWVFEAGDTEWASVSSIAVGAPATLLSLIGPTDDIDGIYHSQVAAIPPTVLALCVVAPLILRREYGWTRVALAGLFALAMSMGARFQVDPGLGLFPMPLALLDLPGLHFLHFPARIGWAWGLCAGVVAARTAAEILERRPRFGIVLALLLAVDLFGHMGMPWRQRVQSAAVPSAYLAATGPVLDLLPVDVHPTRGLDLRTMAMLCAWQVTHRRPIAEACITTSPGTSPRARLGRWVYARALHGEAIARPLGELGFATAMLHADLYRPGDRDAIRAALLEMDGSPVVSRDGGAYVEAYAVPRVEGADPRTAWDTWMRVPAR